MYCVVHFPENDLQNTVENMHVKINQNIIINSDGILTLN